MFYDWQKEIVVTAGSIEGITATILAITNPGDEVIIPADLHVVSRSDSACRVRAGICST